MARRPSTREGTPVLLLGDGRVVAQGDLGVEAVRQHALVLLHKIVVDAHVPEREARELRDQRIRLRVQPRLDDVDELDGAPLPRSSP